MKRVSLTWLVLIQWVLAFEWLHSGWGKWAESGFIDNISKTLQTFAAKTPYTSYGEFLTSIAVPNADLFGNLIRLGEMGVGLALAIGGIWLVYKKTIPSYVVAILVIASIGGALMNLNFFLASGWSSPSTWGLNLLMFSVHVIFAIYYIVNRKEISS